MFTRSMHLTKQYKTQRWQDSYLFFKHDKVQSSKISCQIVLFQKGLRSGAIPYLGYCTWCSFMNGWDW